MTIQPRLPGISSVLTLSFAIEKSSASSGGTGLPSAPSSARRPPLGCTPPMFGPAAATALLRLLPSSRSDDRRVGLTGVRLLTFWLLPLLLTKTRKYPDTQA